LFEQYLTALQQALANIIFVAAVGNGKRTAGFDFPAGYDLTVAVGAVDSSYKRSSFSNYGTPKQLYFLSPGGNDTLDFSGAPSEHVGSATDSHGTNYCLGTSMATAYASALLALYWADSRFDLMDATNFLGEMINQCETNNISPTYSYSEHGSGFLRFH
jgi:subtilisin family serine protease